jgi:hypothetical protein
MVVSGQDCGPVLSVRVQRCRVHCPWIPDLEVNQMFYDTLYVGLQNIITGTQCSYLVQSNNLSIS